MQQRFRALVSCPPHQWFVACAVVFGLAFTFVTPPYHVPDEYGHMARAYGLSYGQFVTTPQDGKSGSMVPESLSILGNRVNEGFSPTDILTLAALPLASEHTMFVEHPNMVLYSPVIYAPQATGFAVGRLLNLPAISSFYAARLFNLVAYIVLMWLAIRLLPFGKWVAVIVGLLPMHISLAASLSADPVSIGLLAVLVATVLRLRSMERTLMAKEYAGLFALVAAVAVTKLPFPLLIGLFLFVPPKVLGGSRKAWWAYISGLAATAAIAGLGWLIVAKGGLVPYGPQGVHGGDQLHFLLTHPLSFIKALVLTLFSPAGDGYLAMFPLSINYMSAGLPLWITYAYAIFVAFAVYPLRTAAAGTLTRLQKALVAGVVVASVGIIALLLYLSWTPVAKGIIDGMQARYLTPYLFLLVPLLAVRSSKMRTQDGTLNAAWYRTGTALFLFAGVCMTIAYFYFK